MRSITGDTCTSGVPHTKNVDAYGKWLDSLDWDYFCTFTTRYQLSVKMARNTAQRFFKHLSRYSEDGVKMFWVAEPFDTKFGCHIHALLQAKPYHSKPIVQIKKSWQVVTKCHNEREYNNTAIKKYVKTKGAHFYVSKYLHLPGADYDIIF